MYSPFKEENVDYFTFPWKEEEISDTWNFLVKSKQHTSSDSEPHLLLRFESDNNLTSLPRLENVVWRRWFQKKYDLPKCSWPLEINSLNGPLVVKNVDAEMRKSIFNEPKIKDDFGVNYLKYGWNISTQTITSPIPLLQQSPTSSKLKKSGAKTKKVVKFSPKVGRFVFEKDEKLQTSNPILLSHIADEDEFRLDEDEFSLEDEQELFSLVTGGGVVNINQSDITEQLTHKSDETTESGDSDDSDFESSWLVDTIKKFLSIS